MPHLTQAVFAIPGDLATPTGGYAYDREVLRRLAGFGVDVQHLQLPGSFPKPTDVDLAETERRLSRLPGATVLLIDGLAYGVFPLTLIQRLRSPIIALCHHPLGYESGLTHERARYLLATERLALGAAKHVVVTSSATGRLLEAEFAVPGHRITVAEPGTARAVRAHGTGDPLQLLAVGSVVPRKGYTVLVDALGEIAELDWRLTIVGALDRDGEEVQKVKAAIVRSGLRARIELAGAVDDAALAEHYAAADLFVMPSLFEGFGMVLTEAMARGLPIVCTTGGAAAETVPDGAAVKVPPGNALALGGALHDVLRQAALRHQLAEASWASGTRLSTWDDTAGRIAAVLKETAA